MLLDAIATIILAGMMLIPLVNVLVGAVVGAALGGVPGAIIGVSIAVGITFTERSIADRLGWWEPQCDFGQDEAVITTGGRRARTGRTETPRTQPPRQRARPHRSRGVRERMLHAPSVRENQNGWSR